MPIEKTDFHCVVCGEHLVEETKRERCYAKQVMITKHIAFFCLNCGLEYHTLPSSDEK